MKLITERFEDVEYVTEAREDCQKDHYIKGIFLQGNMKNRNGRIYPIKTLDKEVTRYVNEMVKDNRAYGELGHPSGPQINLERISHIITELTKDGNNYIGKAKLTETPMGNIAKGLIKSGGKIGVSSRGMGSIKPLPEGIMEVQSDFRLATAADIVHDPSAPQAFVEGILENVEWIYDPVKGTWHEEALHEIKNELNKLSTKEIEAQALGLFEDYIASLISKSNIL